MEKLIKINERVQYNLQLDKLGYFLIKVDQVAKEIQVMYYNYDKILQSTIVGKNSRDLCLALIEKGWISQLDHAAYLGIEITKAQYALENEIEYVQH